MITAPESQTDRVEVSRHEFEALRAEVAELRQAVEALRDQLRTQEPDLNEETVQILAAAVAAYLGKRATIRFVRRVGESEADAWQNQGRARITASHEMTRTRGW